MSKGQAFPHTRDVYANLLRDTRGLRRDYAIARETWFAELELDQKEQALFELEMMLKGMVCFANRRNHPGAEPQYAPVSQDYHDELSIVHDVLRQCVGSVRTLLGERDKAFSFFRYLESVIPDDGARNKLLHEQLEQHTPEEALFLLRHAFSGYLEMTDGMLRAGRVSHKAFHAVHQTITREIGRNIYFNPLIALEFRAEFDRIRHPRILDLLQEMESETAHKVVALTFLTLFRSLRYIGYLELYASNPDAIERSYVVLAVLRSDLRALSTFLGNSSALAVAEGFERELLSLPALELKEFYDDLSRIGSTLLVLRDALGALSGMLDLEIGRIFEYEIPSLQKEMDLQERSTKLMLVSAQLRSLMYHAVRTVCSHLQPELEPLDLSQDDELRRIGSIRLRRDVWMLIQIIRAFVTKAEEVQMSEHAWEGFGHFGFVQEFMQYFRSIGYQLMRMNDYQGLDPFLDSLKELSRSDLLDKHRLARTVDECKAFRDYLEGLFDSICKRADLKDSPFNKQEAVRTLRLYLQHA
ncbi:MAG: hypothetical protein IPJ88_03090 [Myxococcales bacterium]|nr:MAG: hypothetical protein IPJ88_03090 [Myxococcales bacterium]